MSDKIDWKQGDWTDRHAILNYDIAVAGKPLPFSVAARRYRNVVTLEAYVQREAYERAGIVQPGEVGEYDVVLPPAATDADILRIARMMACQLAAVFGEVLALSERDKDTDNTDTTTQEPTR